MHMPPFKGNSHHTEMCYFLTEVVIQTFTLNPPHFEHVKQRFCGPDVVPGQPAEQSRADTQCFLYLPDDGHLGLQVLAPV